MLLSTHGRCLCVFDVSKRIEPAHFKFEFDRQFGMNIRHDPRSRQRARPFSEADDAVVDAFVDACALRDVVARAHRVEVEYMRLSSMDDDYDDAQQVKTTAAVTCVMCVARRNAAGGKERFTNRRGAVFDREIAPGQMAIFSSDEILHVKTRVLGENVKYEGHVDSIYVRLFL